MDFNGRLTLIIVFAVTVRLVIKQLTKRSDSEPNSRANVVSGEENEEVLGQLTKRSDSEPTSRTDDVSGEENEEVTGQLTKRSDSEPTSRTDDVSGEENEEVTGQLTKRSDSEPTSRTDDVYGETNEEFDPLGLNYKDPHPTGQKKRNRSSEANRSMETEAAYQYDVDSMETEQAYKYDVFLSFCGADTRLTFTDHIYHRLHDAGIVVFLDNKELNYGKKIEEILEAIDESQMYIPIFSQKFASRVWCLREVARMVKRHSESDGKREIFPIFYDVDADDVKLRTNLYKNDILKHKEYSMPEELEQWRSALKEVGRLYGVELKGQRQGEATELIIKEVLSRVGDKRVDLPENLVEDHHQINAIIEKLVVHSGGIRFMGIHGMGGIGKTTLAKVVFNKLCSDFDGVCFLDDIRESSQHNIIKLQKKLVTSIGGSKVAEHIENIGDGVNWIKRVCNTKKVLIVLDNLNKKEQLEKLAGKCYWFGSGSRIIITTRDKSILMTQIGSSSKEVSSQPEGILDYEVHAMEFDQALELFYKHAFGDDFPIQDYYVTLSEAVVNKVARLPLAVEVIGSHLYYCSSTSEPHSDKKELWKETLEKLDRGPFKDVRDALMISYEGLDNEQKEIFLDIACFFTNVDKTYPNIMWANCNYSPQMTISILLQLSLIKIGNDQKFLMHDQIRDLGRQIILQEYPHKYSRVWIHEHALELLEGKKKNGDVKALSLTSDGHGRSITPEEFASLPNLRFLRVKSTGIFGNLDHHLLKPRWLLQLWRTIFTAIDFLFDKLVMLDFSDSNIEDGWGGWSIMKTTNLKVLNLAGCIRLKGTPDLSNFMSLEMLILAHCVNLTTYHSSFGQLKSLQFLNIRGCKLLEELPADIGSLQSLTEIIMPQNSQPFKIPETIGNLSSLTSFVLDDNPGIVQLPNSIGRLMNVTNFSLRGCVGIEKLPSSLGEMKSLIELDLSFTGIYELPDSIGHLKKLKVMEVSYSKIKKFPRTIGQVTMLEDFHAKECKHLTDEHLEEIGNLSHLKILDFSDTHVPSFPWTLGGLSHLQTLGLGSSRLQEVPDLPSSVRRLHLQAHHFPRTLDLSSLVNLQDLELHRLTTSVKEPGPSWRTILPEEQLIHPLPSGLVTLKLRGISLLPPLTNLNKLADLSVIEYPLSTFSVPKDLMHLTKLKLSECKSLVEITGLPLLKNLGCLDLYRLESLVEIHGLSELKSLMYFHISHCYKMERLHSLSKLDKLNQIAIEECPQIRDIKGLLGLESLELGNHGCKLYRLMNGKRWTCFPHSAP